MFRLPVGRLVSFVKGFGKRSVRRSGRPSGCDRPLSRWRCFPRVEELEGRIVPANPAANIDQWASGGIVDTVPTWQNGNLNANNSTYFEGDSVPFRGVLTNLVSGHSYSIEVNWDTTESSGTHAYDYITS